MTTSFGTARAATGFLASALMVASGALHSAAGWPAAQAALHAADATVVSGLAVPWHFGGMSMVLFGVISAMSIRAAVRGSAEALTPARIIGAGYVLFGLVGLIVIKPDPTFALFVVPGVLLLTSTR